MTELIAGISGFIFRHEVTQIKETLANTQRFLVDNTLHSCMSVCVQIKGTFLMTYNEAVMGYDGLDDRSLAVDGVQRRVSVDPFLNFKKMIWLILIKNLDYIGVHDLTTDLILKIALIYWIFVSGC